MKNTSHLAMQTQYVSNEISKDSIRDNLAAINLKLDVEIASKQQTINLQEKEIQRLHFLAEEKNSLLLEMTEKLNECTRNSEGNRQLINKLLNDMDRLNQDIEWYKRTYVQRSFLGMIKEKFFKK